MNEGKTDQEYQEPSRESHRSDEIDSQKKNRSRRNFLRWGAITAGSVAFATLTGKRANERKTHQEVQTVPQKVPRKDYYQPENQIQKPELKDVDDLLSAEELKTRYHTTIVSPTDEPLGTIFELGKGIEQLRPFQQLEGTDNAALYIVPIDATGVTFSSLTDSQKQQLPENVINELRLTEEDEIEAAREKFPETRASKLEKLEENTKKLRTFLDQGKIDSSKYEAMLKVLHEQNKHFLNENPTKDDLLDIVSARGGGLAIITKLSADGHSNGYDFVLYLHVGDSTDFQYIDWSELKIATGSYVDAPKPESSYVHGQDYYLTNAPKYPLTHNPYPGDYRSDVLYMFLHELDHIGENIQSNPYKDHPYNDYEAYSQLLQRTEQLKVGRPPTIFRIRNKYGTHISKNVNPNQQRNNFAA